MNVSVSLSSGVALPAHTVLGINDFAAGPSAAPGTWGENIRDGEGGGWRRGRRPAEESGK